MDSEERLWIIFEDYDLRPLDNKKLLDFIESNAPVDIEFVIAMTPDRENKLDKVQTGTFTDRNDFYKFQGENEDIPFFNEETIAEFIEPFLYYLKNTHIGKSVCKECGKCDDEIINLYPFSHSFIKKLYNGFRKKPTPRKYVELISDLLDDFRTNYIPPYNSEILGSYKIEADIPPNLEESEAFIEWYYGEESSEKKLKKLAHSLDLDEDNLSFDILKTNTSEEGLEPIDEDNQEESKLQKLIPQIRYWIQDPSDEEYSECNSYIKQGVLFLAKNLTDNWRVDDPWTERKSPNVYFHISRSEKVHFEEDDFDSEIILIPLDLMTFESAKSLLEIGYKTNEHIYDDFNEIPKDKLKTTVGLIEYGIKNWRDKIIENNFDRDMSYSNKSQKNLDDLIAFSIGLLSDLSNPFDKYNQSDFDSIINEGINLNDNIVEYFSRKKGFDMSLIANKTKNLLELFRWRFSIDGKNLSPIKYEEHKSSFRYFYTYNYFKKTEAKKNISNKFRLGKEKTKMGNILPAIFTFVENIFENDLFSNEEYIKTNEIKNFYKNVKNIEKSDFERIDTLSYLEGTDVLAIIQSFMGGWDNQDINIFLDKLDIYLKTNSKKKDLQNIILKNDYFYNFYTKIIKTKTYKDFKDEHSYRFSDFLNFLEKQNELKKRKEKQDKIKNIKKEIGEIYDDIEIINNLENNSIEPMQRENVDNVNDLQDLKDIKAKLRQKKQNYFYSQKEKLNIFRKYKHFFEDDDMIKEFNRYIKDSRKQLSRENLKILIETRKKLENEFENIFDFIDTEKRYKLAKDNKVNLMELSGEEIEKLKKSEIKDSIYLVLES